MQSSEETQQGQATTMHELCLRRLRILVLDFALYLFDFVSDIVNGLLLLANGHYAWGTVLLLTTNIPGWIWGYMWYSRVNDENWTKRWKYYVFGWVIVPFRTLKGYSKRETFRITILNSSSDGLIGQNGAAS